MPYAKISTESWPVELHYEHHYPSAEESIAVDDTKGATHCRGHVLCIMGFTAEGYAWQTQVDFLTSLGYHCVTFDNRGCGRSSARLGRYTTSLLATDALELMVNELKWNPAETHVLGISMGGMITLEMLAMLAEGQCKHITTDTHVLSASLMVTQMVGWRSSVGMPTLSGLWGTMSGMLSFASPRDRALRALAVAFSPEWLEQSSGNIHPRTGRVLTNFDMIIRRGAANRRAKKEEGKRVEISMKGLIGQSLALITHRVAPERMAMIRHAGTPLLVVMAGQDNLVRPESQARLAEMASPFEVIHFAEAPHCVNEVHKAEVNGGVQRLLEYAEGLKGHGWATPCMMKSNL